MPEIMTGEYCRTCPFFDKHLGYLEKDDPYWREHPCECACKECPDREHCEQYGPKTLWECLKSEIIRKLKGEPVIMEVKQALDAYLKARDELKSLAHKQYTEDNCPLNSTELDHHGLAQALWGTGQYEWNCEFCGEEFLE